MLLHALIYKSPNFNKQENQFNKFAGVINPKIGRKCNHNCVINSGLHLDDLILHALTVRSNARPSSSTLCYSTGSNTASAQFVFILARVNRITAHFRRTVSSILNDLVITWLEVVTEEHYIFYQQSIVLTLFVWEK